MPPEMQERTRVSNADAPEQAKEPGAAQALPEVSAGSALTKTESLLLENPELLKFWDGDRKLWVVSQERFEAAVGELGLDLPAPEPVQHVDIFDDTRSYAGIAVEERQGLGVVAVPEGDLLLPQDVVLLVGEGLLEALGCNVDGVWEAEDETKGWEILKEGCDIRVFRIDTPADLPIDRSILGDSLKAQAQVSLSDSFQIFFDKVGQRKITSSLESVEIGQPRFLDVRGLHPPDPVVRFSKIDLSGFPLEEIEKADLREKRMWVFEDVHQGFAVIHDGTQRFVTSQNRSVMLVAGALRLEKDASAVGLFEEGSFDQRLARFLRILQKKDLPQITLARSEAASELEDVTLSDLHENRLEARQLLSHPSPVFIKSSRGSGGARILRCSKNDRGDSIIESNSPQVGEQLAEYLRRKVRYFEQKKVQEDNPSGSVAVMIARSMEQSALDGLRSLGSVESFLANALREMKTPIVEEEVPVERLQTELGREKVEFRMIVQGHDRLELVADYAKCSLNDVAANISLNGFARSTKDVIDGIFKQRLAGQASELEINRRAAQSFQKLQSTAEIFAQEFAQKLSESAKSARPNDFAVDILPVWDEQRGDLKLFLLEVQYLYDFDGLERVDPAKAAQVRAFKGQATKAAIIKGFQRFFNVSQDDPLKQT